MAQDPSAWQRLTSVATLGTRRGALPAIDWPDATLEAAASEQPEVTLLRAAAARRVCDLAGVRAAPMTAPSLPELAARAEPYLSEAAAMRLIRMITGVEKELASEWFALAIPTGRCLPPQFVPVVLAALDPIHDEGFGAMVGPVGTWLASLKPEWRTKLQVKEPSEARWQEGSLEERRLELQAMRARDPDRARAWLEDSWASEPPEAREAFVSVLMRGLSPADEPFLERALDDKRKAVRQGAVQCLARLPGSAHARRNLERLAPLISCSEKKTGLLGKLSKRKLTIELPASIDKATQRDGIELKVPAQLKVGERTFWLMQMIALAPAQHWTTRFDCEPAEFLAALAETDYAKELLDALTSAVTRSPESSWLAALSETWLESKRPLHEISQAIGNLIAAAPPESRSALLEQVVDMQSDSKNLMTVLAYLQNTRFQWSAALTRKVFEGIAPRLRAEQGYSQNRTSFEPIGYCCEVETALRVLPEVLERTPPDSSWRNALERLNELVEFRAAMKRELT